LATSAAGKNGQRERATQLRGLMSDVATIYPTGVAVASAGFNQATS
jgi:hypothetical protein